MQLNPRAVRIGRGELKAERFGPEPVRSKSELAALAADGNEPDRTGLKSS